MRLFCLGIVTFFAVSLPVWAMDGIRVHGSTTVYNNLISHQQNALEAALEEKMHLLLNGSSLGVVDLLEGRSDVALSSAPLNVLNLAGNYDLKSVQDHQIGRVDIYFAKHKSNPVKKLTKLQLKEILLGKITNWQDVGGHDSLITIFVEPAGGGVRTSLEMSLLEGKSLKGEVSDVPNALAVIPVAAREKDALLILSGKRRAVQNLEELELDFTLNQDLYLVVKRPISKKAQKLLDVFENIK